VGSAGIAAIISRPRGRREVDRIAKVARIQTAINLKIRMLVDQASDRSAQTIQFPNDQNIILALASWCIKL
jgi:hypothetical protein